MPSRAEIRVVLERLLRGIVIAALAAMLWQSLRAPTDSGGETVAARGVRDLADWTSSPKAPGDVHVQMENIPNPQQRAWLGALAGTGSRVTWSGDLPAMMIDAQPVASPAGGARVLVASPRGSSVVVSDDIGPINTVRAELAGVRLALGSAAGELSASAGGSAASTTQTDSVMLRKIIVIASAGWESKFVVAALEEEGWKVDAFIRVAPGVDVTQGSAAAIDTARYSAVIALDRAASLYANRIIEFARKGGGVVLTPQAASLDALSSIRAGTVNRANTTARPIQTAGFVSLTTLPFAPIISLRGDAVPLDRRAGAVASAAKRVGAGRVVQLGYEDTWRWRMGGGEAAVRDHRVWWTEIVSSVAYAPVAARALPADSRDRAPMVGLVDGIGPGMPTANVASLAVDPSDWMAWLFVLLALGILGEVGSRRIRGQS